MASVRPGGLRGPAYVPSPRACKSLAFPRPDVEPCDVEKPFLCVCKVGHLFTLLSWQLPTPRGSVKMGTLSVTVPVLGASVSPEPGTQEVLVTVHLPRADPTAALPSHSGALLCP